jgi:hypothetical protein
MKPAVFCLLLAGTLSAQAIPENSTIARLKSTIQQINLGTVHKPTSLVIAVRTNDAASEALAAIRQVAPTLEPLVAGGGAEIALLSYGDRIRTILPFTSDSAALSNAIADLQVSGTSVAVIDAIEEAISELETRPTYRRRIVLLIGESRDPRGQGRVQKLVERAQRSNVLIYAIAAP